MLTMCMVHGLGLSNISIPFVKFVFVSVDDGVLTNRPRPIHGTLANIALAKSGFTRTGKPRVKGNWDLDLRTTFEGNSEPRSSLRIDCPLSYFVRSFNQTDAYKRRIRPQDSETLETENKRKK